MLQRLSITVVPALFVVLWASGFVGAKFGLPSAEPMPFLALRMAAAVMLFLVVAAVAQPVWPRRREALHQVVAGLLVHGCYLGGVFIALDYGMPTGLVALVVGLQPILVSTLAGPLLGERVTPRQWLGLGLAFVGLSLVVQGRTDGEGTLAGWVAATVALFGITLGTLYQKRYGGGVDWRAAMPIQFGACGVVFAVATLMLGSKPVVWNADFVFALGWLVVVLSVGASGLLYLLIRRQAATKVASLFCLTPPMTALMGFAFFGERLGVVALAGMVLCVLGVALVNWPGGIRTAAAD